MNEPTFDHLQADSVATFECYRGSLLADATGLAIADGAVLVEVQDCVTLELDGRPLSWGRLTVRAIGEWEDVREAIEHLGTPVQVHDCTGSVLIPGLVNAHTHLDLTHIGPKPFDPGLGFVGFVGVVRSGRAQSDEDITRSVWKGVQYSLRGGVVAVGDIAGVPGMVPSMVPFKTLSQSPLRGVSYVEYFAVGKGERSGVDRVRAVLDAANPDDLEYTGVRLGLQPHATYTVTRQAFADGLALAAKYGLPLSTHLAEHPEERAYIAHATGPQRELLEHLGLWDESAIQDVGGGETPISHMQGILSQAPFLVAHVNDLSDSDLQILRSTLTHVAYCPRSSAYFKNHEHFGPHRYRDMLKAGVPVALGTDSIINLPTLQESEQRISTFDEARVLFSRDGTDALELLGMATTRGAAALGLPPSEFTFRMNGGLSGVVAVVGKTLEDALRGSECPKLLSIGK